jgi:acyl dehydratase
MSTSDQLPITIELGPVERSSDLTITSGDFGLLQSISWLTTQLHTNEEYMERESQFGHRIMSGPINFALISGLWYSDLARPFADRHHIVLGAATRVEMRFRHPLMIGDTLHLESKAERVEPSGGDGTDGTIVFADRGVNQRGQVAIEAKRWVPFTPAP